MSTAMIMTTLRMVAGPAARDRLSEGERNGPWREIFFMRTLEAKILDSTHLELSEPIPVQSGHHVKVSIQYDEEEESPDTDGEPQPDTSADDASAPRPSGPRRERELAWCRSHEDVLRAYEGQWVVLEGEEVVAHGRHPAQLVEQARAKGIRTPYIFYVEEFRPDVVTIGL